MLKKSSPLFALKCKICEKPLHGNFKTLCCLHSFCFQCLVDNFTEQLNRSARYGLPDTFFDDEEENVVHCPECYIDVPVTNNKTNNAHVNATATDLVNRLGAVSFLTHLIKTARQLDLRRKCERCTSVEEGSIPDAVAFCENCEKSYCSTCLTKHAEFLAGHALLDLSTLNENRMMSVSDGSGFKEEGCTEVSKANPEGNLSTAEEDDDELSSMAVSKSSVMKRVPYLSYVSDKKLVPTDVKKITIKSEFDAGLSDEGKQLHPSFYEPLSSSVETAYNFHSANANSNNMKIEKLEEDFKKREALRKIIVASKCLVHEMSFIAYCTRCDLCLCQRCWEQHSTKSKDCTNIVPLKTIAGEKRTQGYALLTEARLLIRLLNRKYLESLKKVQLCTEKCFDENEADYNGPDIDTIQAFQHQYFRQNQLHCKQLFCFMAFLGDVVHLVPDADLLICFKSLADFWRNLSSQITKKTGIPEIEPEKSNVHHVYGKLETLSVTVEHESLDYSEKQSLQLSRASIIKKKCTAQSKIIDTTTQPVFSPSVVDSTYLALKETDYISAIVVSSDLNILLCLYYQCCVKIFDSKGMFVTTIQIPGEPSDICAIKGTMFAVSLPLRKKMAILLSRRKPDKKRTFFVHQVVDVQKSYVSISTTSSFSIIACDVYKNVDLITINGTVQSSILKQTEPNKPGAHRLSPGPFKCTFLLLDYIHQTISCYSQNGILQFCIDTTTENSDSNGTSDISLGKSGRIYISDCRSVYSMDATNDPKVLWTFEDELTEEACIAFTPQMNHLVVSCIAGMDKSLLILNISDH